MPNELEDTGLLQKLFVR